MCSMPGTLPAPAMVAGVGWPWCAWGSIKKLVTSDSHEEGWEPLQNWGKLLNTRQCIFQFSEDLTWQPAPKLLLPQELTHPAAAATASEECVPTFPFCVASSCIKIFPQCADWGIAHVLPTREAGSEGGAVCPFLPLPPGFIKWLILPA